MNDGCNIFIYSIITTQHLLNKQLDKRETDKRMPFFPQQPFSVVEILLRVYIVYYQHSYMSIQQFNKKRMILQGFKLFPCDGVETTDSFYRLIPAFPVVVEPVGGIGQSVGCRCEFPAFLQHLSDLVLLHLYLRVYQQKKDVVIAERECVRACTVHDVKYKLRHFYLQSVAVAADNLPQGFRVY